MPSNMVYINKEKDFLFEKEFIVVPYHIKEK